MISQKEVSIIYETLLSSPGMNDSVKIDFKLTRKNILLFSRIIELGLKTKEDGAAGALLSAVDNDTITAFKTVVADMLKKAGLTETNDRLAAIVAP